MLVEDLRMMLQVSFVKLVSQVPEVDGWKFDGRIEILGSECQVMISEARGSKCPRCWTYAAAIQGQVCDRCSMVMTEKATQNDLGCVIPNTEIH